MSISRPSQAAPAPSIQCDAACVLTQGQRFEFSVRVTPANAWFTVGGLSPDWALDEARGVITGTAQDL